MPRHTQHSEEFEDILTQMPQWTMRWGIAALFIFMSIIIGATWFIHYPDVVIAQCRLTSADPPAKIIAQASGRIVDLYVKDTSLVKAGQPIALLETAADPIKIAIIKKQLTSISQSVTKAILAENMYFPEYSTLGEVQTAYSDFLLAVSDYRFYSSTEYNSASVVSIEKQITYAKSVEQKLKQQKELLKRDLELAERKMDNDKVLRQKGHISDADLALSESNFLQKKYALDALDANIVNNSMRVVDAQKNIQETEQQRQERIHITEVRLRETYKNLQSAIELWEKKYMLRSPIDGTISFYRVWSKNQSVNQGDEVFTVIPPNIEIIGKVNVPQYGAGKVHIGSPVILKFDNYPYTEFGAVAGTIRTMSLSAKDNAYIATISLDKGLTTSYGKTLTFQQDMEGKVEIITENIRLLERLLLPLKQWK